MSETPTAAATRPKPAKGAGKKYAGLTRNQWLIAGGVFVAALGYILWKRHQASTAAASTGSTAATNQGSNECTDANGNPVDCNEAFAAELAAMQNALDQLGANSGAGGGSSGGGTAGTTTPVTTDGGTGATSTTQPSGTATSTSGTTATKTGTGTVATKPAAPATPGNVHATSVTRSSITVAWNKVPNATSYRIRVTYQSQLVKQQTATGTSATISGLGADHTYGVHLAAVGPGGTSPEGDVQIKTAK